MSHSPEFRIWAGLNKRCYAPQTKRFHDYGGRGLTVSVAWRHSFEAFYRDMGPRPSAAHSIERRDNEQGYAADNCYWATVVQQANNKRTTHRLTLRGETRTLGEWARITGLPRHVLHGRQRLGWADERTLTEAVHPHGG